MMRSSLENDDAFAAGKLVERRKESSLGISSGAAIWAAIELAKRPENAGKTIVALLRIPATDTFPHRYLRTKERKQIKIYEKDCGSISVDMWICRFLCNRKCREFLLHKKGINVLKMHTRAKM